jgi:hypothetical protein
MTVAVEGELDAGVPHKVLDVLRVRTPSEQEGEVAMPEIVPAYIGQLCTS